MSSSSNINKLKEDRSERWKFTVMWTKQLQKKAKVWQDGHLIFSISSKKLNLISEEGTILTSKLYPSLDPVKKFKLNEEVKIGAFLITIESLPNFNEPNNGNSNIAIENAAVNAESETNNQLPTKPTNNASNNLPPNNLKRKPNFNRPFVSPMIGNQKTMKLTSSASTANSLTSKTTRSLVTTKPRVPGFTISSDVSYSPLSNPMDMKSKLSENPTAFEYMEYLGRLSIDQLQTVIEDFSKLLGSCIREIQTNEVSKHNLKEDINHPNFFLYQAQNFNLICQYKAELSSFSMNNEFKKLGIDIYDENYTNTVTNMASKIDSYLTSSLFNTKIQLKLHSYAPRHLFSKDDLWILTKTLKFEYNTTVLLKSNNHGCPNKLIDLTPLGLEDEAKFFQVRDDISESGTGYLIRGCNIGTEISLINNLIPLEINYDHFESLLDTNLIKFISSPFDPSLIGEVEEESKSDPNISDLSVTEINVQEGEITEELISHYSMVYSENYSLNLDQGEVLLEFLKLIFLPTKAQTRAPVQLVHGVYGSGKSLLISIMIISAVEISDNHNIPKKILLACMTNVAVDNILLKLKDLGFERFVRVGSLKRINKRVLPFSAQNKKRQRDDIEEIKAMINDLDSTDDQEDDEQREVLEETLDRFQRGLNQGLVQRCPVVGATCLSTSQMSMDDIIFDVVIQDECSQLTEPLSLLSLTRFTPKNLVLVGDPNQLPPTVNSSNNYKWVTDRLKLTLFDKFYEVGIKPKMLRTQYRCNPIISKLSNLLFYKNMLIDGVSEFERSPIHPNLPNLCFINVEGKETNYKTQNSSYYNELEINTIGELITELKAIGVNYSEIGIISLYKNQVEKLSKMINSGGSRFGTSNNKNNSNIQISTVDAFQGAEKSIIIVSCVRTFSTNFLTNINRINVAITRAKKHLFIIGNGSKLKLIPLWKKLINNLPNDNGYFTDTDDFLSLFTNIPKVKEAEPTNNQPKKFVKFASKPDFKTYEPEPKEAVNKWKSFDDGNEDLSYNSNSTKVAVKKTVAFAEDPMDIDDEESIDHQAVQTKSISVSEKDEIVISESKLDEQLDELFDLL